jgi:poly(3-hydroxybutyrate) depolymerase
LTGFMSMNLDRHTSAHKELFLNLVRGDGDSAEKHRVFYDEYLAVMDLAAEFFLDTIDSVFVRHALPQGQMQHRGRPVALSAIQRTPIFTIEGEKDDITGLGQCRAALGLCDRLDASLKQHYECAGVGHYGTFNGSRFRAEIAPRIGAFVRAHDGGNAEAEPPAPPAPAPPAPAPAKTTPFRMFARAGRLVIEGMLNSHAPGDR